ncbi:DUF2306 domain-containing protein [Gordonia sp. ABSL1-1]|uniref:DUF2306 domain-containing protein n=1 Tax=Gordonia sp. ABSL1-1 TaxID=3053923 RepID=UPI0025744035|nr:DUF2306 domain-containing protein [Gordonia sp. ABSL1-1]MDL9935400.1 DUF2306 domain-containing protein [Gordonia sp. ABSL1-1]
MLVVHVTVAAVAMCCAAGQVWAWWRHRNPQWHRREGRLYVLAVAIAGPSAFAIGTHSPFGPAAQVSDVILACLWMGYTAFGVRAIVGGRVDLHRRWMIRSACLAFSVILNRVYGTLLATVGSNWLESHADGIDDPVAVWTQTLSPWLGLVTGILLGLFVSDRQPSGPPIGGPAGQPAHPPVGGVPETPVHGRVLGVRTTTEQPGPNPTGIDIKEKP